MRSRWDVHRYRFLPRLEAERGCILVGCVKPCNGG
jgi:hypothetical protein